MAQTTLVAISDLHINSTVSICPPRVQLDDGGTYHASRLQRAIWENWLDFCEKVGAIESERVILVINGDIGELDTKRRSNQIISPNKATIQTMIADVLEPLISLVDMVIVIRGTQAHEGKSAWLEEAVAKDYQITLENKQSASWWHFRGVVGSRRMDIAHHGRGGTKPWTKGAGALKKAAETVYDYMAMGDKPPELVLRAHNHTVEDSGENHAPVHVWHMPAWTAATEFAYRVGFENRAADIGGLIVDCDGEYKQPRVVIYKPRAVKLWAFKI